MPKLVCLLAAALMLVSDAATAHSWYPKECCHDKDCHPVPCAELKVTANGDVMWKGVLYFSAPMMRDSLDGQCHVCLRKASTPASFLICRYAFSSRTRRAERHDR
jgi:hypothetical protein